MSTDELILKQRQMIEQLKDGSIMAIAVADTHAKMTERIFQDGKKSDGSDIGQYQGGELYVNPNLSPKKFPAIGKTGKGKFESTGEPHKTGYFESYKAYREKIGRLGDKVNLVLSGQLQSDISNGLVQKSEFEWIVSAKNTRNKKIIEGVDEKYGKTFALSVEEVFNYREVFNFEFLNVLKSA